MISNYNHKLILVAVLAIVSVISCSDPWDDHAKMVDANLNEKLNIRINNTPETSDFGALLIETGYDSILSSAKTYTVWVPTNEAMAQVDASVLADMEDKQLFVLNHIALTSYSSVTDKDTVSVAMLSDKYLEFKNGNMIAESNVLTADQYAENGLYHIIDKALTPRRNIWEYLQDEAASNAMSKFIMSLDEFDIYPSDSLPKAMAEKSEEIMFADSLTNSYLLNVYNLNNEKNKYTFFLLEDEGYKNQVETLKPYLNKGTTDSTTTYASYFAVRDMAFHKSYSRENLPDALTSRFGVKVPVNKNRILEEVKLSNGILFKMSTVDVPLEKRLLSTVIEGENPSGFSQGDKRINTFYREKASPSGEPFSDIMVQNHEVPKFGIYYTANNLYSTTYRVYWRAVNDIQENTFQQALRIGGEFQADGTVANPIASLPYTDVPPDDYSEVFIGEFTLEEAGNLDLITLLAANTAVNGQNTLTLDYLKFVPVIK
ncbi:fasciclin domain-containing protein [Zunongwangia pacifica]|uniref:Fasciclin domain-containing protein n=1 Tax=Zunongwangia pacifica TaxID=2911062 RepID=A0A9X2CP16_9FLAO|nr:fasciclin domain-containing protein [Zunongwangia pacifica]MCL6217502.1 fasciclin domain-containing protein [Zunongwangia pacifica]